MFSIQAQNKILSQTEKIFMPDMTEKKLIFLKNIYNNETLNQ